MADCPKQLRSGDPLLRKFDLRHRPSLHRVGPPRNDHASCQGGSVPVDHVSACGDRANGVQQLHFAIDRHSVSVHGLWFCALWKAAALSAVLRRGSDLDWAAYRQPHLASPFPLWSTGMGLAIVDILEAPAHAYRALSRSGRVAFEEVAQKGPRPACLVASSRSIWRRGTAAVCLLVWAGRSTKRPWLISAPYLRQPRDRRASIADILPGCAPGSRRRPSSRESERPRMRVPRMQGLPEAYIRVDRYAS